MIELHITISELEIIERALRLASDSGQMPDTSIKGDATRVLGLRETLRKARKAYEANRWWGSRRS